MSEATRLDILAALLAKAPDEVFIQPHNVPDPDAIASSAGMQHLLALRGIKTVIVYDREIEKADTTRMLGLFGIGMIRAKDASTLGEEDWALLVDERGFGGGHGHMAGGFIPADNVPADRLIDTFLRHRAILFEESARHG